MIPIFWLILISKFHSSMQLYGYHNLDILIAFPIIAAETFLSGSTDSMDFKKIKKRVFCTKRQKQDKAKIV